MEVEEQVSASMPDIYGLPEYRITEYATEIDGRDVRMAFGTKRFGQVQWLYTVVTSPEQLLLIIRHLERVSIEALMAGSGQVNRH